MPLNRPPHHPEANGPAWPTGGVHPPTGGSLPPWSSLGLGADPEPALDRDWNPLHDRLDDAALPERPPRDGRRGALTAAVVGIALLLLGAAAVIAWAGFRGDDPPPSTPARLGAAGPTAETAGSAASPTGARPSATPTGPSAGKPSDGGHPPSSPSPPPAKPALLLAVGDDDLGGVKARDVAAALRDALADETGQAVAIVGLDRAAEADLVIAVELAPGSPGARPLASEPLALVTSPRLALHGVGRPDAERLLTGQVTDWRTVGAASSLAVVPLGLAGPLPPTARPVETFDDYAGLVAALDRLRGGVALAPVSVLDARVNVLAIEGVDPLRHGVDPATYPFARTMSLVVRPASAPLLPTIEATLRALGLPTAGGVPTATVAIAGNIAPGPLLVRRMTERDDFTLALGALGPTLAAVDLTIAGFAPALGEAEAGDGTAGGQAVIDPRLARGVAAAGVDAVLLTGPASGNAAARTTQDVLTAAGIGTMGEQTTTFQVNGLAVGVVGIAGLTADRPIPETTLGAIREAATAGIAIALIRIGEEDGASPAAWATAARQAIDAGASLVVVDGPRAVQGMERYRDRPIVYGLGAFVADPARSVAANQGLIVEATFRGRDLIGFRLHGVTVDTPGAPRPMTDGEEAALADRFWSLTDANP